MAFVHGKDTKVYGNGWNLTSFFNQSSWECMRDVADATTYGDSDREYLAGQRDATLAMEGLFDGADDQVDEILTAALSGDDSIWNLLPAGDANGRICFGFDADETDYSVDSPEDGAVATSMEAQSTVGRERLVIHHALGAETGTVNGATQDNAAATTNGGVGYLQVTAIAGAAPSVTVTIEDSADGASWATILTFTAVTAANSKERVAITGNVRRYTRAVITFGGTTTSITVFVAFGRK